MNHVATDATSPATAPQPIGARYSDCRRDIPAVIAERTRTDSRPSRKTSTAISSVALTGERRDAIGSGVPNDVIAVHTSRATTRIAPIATSVRTVRDDPNESSDARESPADRATVAITASLMRTA